MADHAEKPKKSRPTKESKAPRPARPISRWGVGGLAIFQVVLAFVIFIAATYLGMSHYQSKDLTQNGTFTLSETTIKLLDSDLLQKREKPIKIIAALRKTSPHASRFRKLVNEYAHHAHGKLDVEYVDPIRNQDRALEVSTQYGNLLKDQLFIDDLFIIDARDAATDDKKSPGAGLRYLQAKDMVVWKTDDKKQRRIIGYRDEDSLSTALRSALEGQPRKFYFIADKSKLDVGDMGSPWRVLAEAFLQQNIALIPLKITEIKEIPTDAEGLALIAPSYDLEESELEIIKKYWARRKASLLVTLDPAAETPNLTAFFRRYGVTPRNDRIITTRDGRTETQISTTFMPGLDLNASLDGQATTFEGRVCSLEVREGADDLASQRVQVFSLIETSAGYWGETRYTETDPVYNDNEDHSAPLSLAAAIIKGNANADSTADDVSKMVVISTSDFLHPDRLRQEQLDFLKNTANWLIGEEDMMGIGPRGLERRKLNLIGSQVDFLQSITFRYLPLGFLLIGALVWNTRRA